MNIKNLLKRNLPVFAIGGLTVLIFLVIIVSAQKNTSNPTKLVQLDNNDLIATHTFYKGPTDAPVVVVEFSDYECPACKLAQTMRDDLWLKYPKTLKWAYRHFPLPQHRNAQKAAIAAQAAGEQGKFWEFSDLMFQNQDKLSDQDLLNYAKEVNLDTKKFSEDINTEKIKNMVNDDKKFAAANKFNGTPTFFINGKLATFNSIEELRKLIETELAKYPVVSEKNDTDSKFDDLFNNTGDTSTIKNDESDDKVVDIKDLTQEEKDKIILNQVHNMLDDKFGTVEINYTDKGFTPRDTQATAGQIVKWTNKTDKDIKLTQIIKLLPELEEPRILKPNESLEIRLNVRKTGLWTYRAEGDVGRSSILIIKVNDDIEKLLPESIK